jgi:hypothetical protein
MTDKKNVVSKTIKAYEELAEDYSKTHSDINEIKNIADFFIQNLKGQKLWISVVVQAGTQSIFLKMI